MSILRNPSPAKSLLSDAEKRQRLFDGHFKPDANGVLTKHLKSTDDTTLALNANKHNLIAEYLEVGIKLEFSSDGDGGFILWPSTDSFLEQAAA